MLRRRLLAAAILLAGHVLASVLAFVMAYAAATSPGGGWVVTIIGGIFFFPLLGLYSAGVKFVPLDSPLGLVVNSALWVAAVYPVWLLAGWGWTRVRRSPMRLSRETALTAGR
jgi:hypothetical protein